MIFALEQSELDAIVKKFPTFKGSLPEEAKYWTQADVEKYVISDGSIKPPAVAPAARRSTQRASSSSASSQTCPLLTRCRVKLAEERISDVSFEQRSFCRRRAECGDRWSLTHIAECLEVSKHKEMPADCRIPVVIDKPRDWKTRSLNMAYWGKECPYLDWVCRARSPGFPDDPEGIDAFTVQATLQEYVEYMKLVQMADRKCLEENTLAFPRVSFHECPVFNLSDQTLALFASSWTEMLPAKVKDLNYRWLHAFCTACHTDYSEAMARFFSISFRATGCSTRLHTPPHGAHVWHHQVEGRTVYYVFPPQEASNLYAGYTTGESPVDVFYPSTKRHPKFAEAKGHVAVVYMGQTMVIPSGWWYYSVAIEPSTILTHQFWNMENKVYFTDALRACFTGIGRVSRSQKQKFSETLDSLHDQIMKDQDSGDERSAD